MNSDEDCDTHDLINAQPKPIAEAIVRIIEEAGSFDADFDILLEAARLIVGRDDEITRLLAIEAAAKKLGEALEWVMKDYEGMCREGYQASANWKKRVVMAKASSKAFQRSINPIGDKK